MNNSNLKYKNKYKKDQLKLLNYE